MNRISIQELKTKFTESINDLKEKLDNKDLEGSRVADKRTRAIRDEIRKRELEEAFNVDENDEALQIMFKYLQTQPEFVAFYNANAKSDSSSVNFSGC